MLPYLWMLLGSLAFAVMAACAHELGQHCDWRVIAVARAFFALVFTALLVWQAGVRLVVWRPRILWVRSIAGSLSMVASFYSFTHLPISDVLTLTNTFPLWVAVLSWPLLGEVPAGSTWLAILSGVVGVGLIQQPHLATGNPAALIALASAVSTAVAMLGLHRLHGVDHRAVVVHFSGVGLLVCVLACFLFPRPVGVTALLEGWSWLLLLSMGVTATVGQILLTLAFAAGPPARVSVVCLSQVVFALLLDLWLLHHSINAMTLLGMALVLLPTSWVMLRHNQRRVDDNAEGR